MSTTLRSESGSSNAMAAGRNPPSRPIQAETRIDRVNRERREPALPASATRRSGIGRDRHPRTAGSHAMSARPQRPRQCRVRVATTSRPGDRRCRDRVAGRVPSPSRPRRARAGYPRQRSPTPSLTGPSPYQPASSPTPSSKPPQQPPPLERSVGAHTADASRWAIPAGRGGARTARSGRPLVAEAFTSPELQALIALLGHSSAEMSLRYGRLFDQTVRADYERGLTLAKERPGPVLPVASTQPPDGDCRELPLIKSRLARGSRGSP